MTPTPPSAAPSADVIVAAFSPLGLGRHALRRLVGVLTDLFDLVDVLDILGLTGLFERVILIFVRDRSDNGRRLTGNGFRLFDTVNLFASVD
jgi:hypothetical protein